MVLGGNEDIPTLLKLYCYLLLFWGFFQLSKFMKRRLYNSRRVTFFIEDIKNMIEKIPDVQSELCRQKYIK